MKWRVPQENETRTVVRFAWFPVELSNGQAVWLERYKSTEKFRWSGGWEGYWGWFSFWREQ